ncbi:MAG TPA: DUF5131 family protein [Bryobacteraceae bacterium]|nr:DUF5131 family protein [Blastocatellia bacterium]HXJ42268.1 DUF5131 family protein [Bryobacteraceae bacterium]
MGLSSIEWTGYTWNPIKARTREDLVIPTKADPFRVVPAGTVGYHCERVSSGCCNCYACTGNMRTLPAWGTGLDYTVPNRAKVEIFLDEDVLVAPLHWKKPRKIFVCSMTDWAADFVTDEMMDKLLAIAALCPQHTFQFLTKRADRMARYFSDLGRVGEQVAGWMWDHILTKTNLSAALPQLPLPNVQLGFSAEDQANFDARSEQMKKLARAGWFTWCSYEPALGPIRFGFFDPGPAFSSLRWVVVGGESGPGARPFHLDWARNTIRECQSAGVPVFMKQVGARPIGSSAADLMWLTGMKDRKGGCLEEWPEDLRVREFPIDRYRLGGSAEAKSGSTVRAGVV